MSKLIRCKDIGMDCDFEARSDSEAELLKKAAAHAQSVHNMTDMSEEIVAKVRSVIRDE